MIKFLLIVLTLIPLALKAQLDTKSAEEFIREVNSKIPRLLNNFAVPGAALGIIDDGEIILQKGYGSANIEESIPVTTQTGFNIGSISKTFAAWGIMKLVQEGKIDLDTPVENYLTRWHLPESNFDSNGVTIRRCLSHTAGLSLHGYPGWSPDDVLPSIEESLNGKNNGPGPVEIILQPGSEYKYSGGGYTILQLIIEEVTGQKFDEFMKQEILDPLGLTNSSYKIDDRILASSSSEYNTYGEEIDFELFTAEAAAGFHTTIEDFTRFAMANLFLHPNHSSTNSFLSQKELESMMQNTPMASGRYGYGMGYQTHSIIEANWILAGHRGANDGWRAIFKVHPFSNDGFIMITNGGGGQGVYHAIYADWVKWQTGVDLEDWHYAPPGIGIAINQVIEKEGIDRAKTVYSELKMFNPDKYNFGEDQLNDLGYHYASQNNLDIAKAIFELNVQAFPFAFNTYDSYGEILLSLGDKEGAIENYSQSVKLNPRNENGVQMLKSLGVAAEDVVVNITEAELEPLLGSYVSTNDPSWSFEFEIDRGFFFGKDGDFQFGLVPLGENKFVYPGSGTLLEFNTDDPKAITLIFDEENHFEKVD